MSMTQRFDLICIGTGTAASTVASRCRAAGWTVAIIDKRPFGGTCALRGCDPKKVLVGVADVVDWARRMKGRGVDETGFRIEWAELMRFKRTFTDPVPQSKEDSFRKEGIATFHGPARFTGPNSVEVGGRLLEARYIVIATGAKPASLGIAGEDLITISDQFLELDTLPPRIIFIGGGYISMEFAHAPQLRARRSPSFIVDCVRSKGLIPISWRWLWRACAKRKSIFKSIFVRRPLNVRATPCG